MSQPCPICGGTDRFVRIDRPRNGGKSFWWCRQCRHVAGASSDGPAEPVRTLTSNERAAVYAANTAIAEWCRDQLWSDAGAAAREFLTRRGFTNETIQQARLGFHPDVPVGGVATYLYHQTSEPYSLYEASRLGGATGPQGRIKHWLRGAITIPYFDTTGLCAMLRTRRLAGGYFSAPGIPLYAGGTPTLWAVDHTAPVVVLTEGEFKALASVQAGQSAFAQPGVSYLPAAYLQQLKGKTVILCYDTEPRTDPFVLSPGERGTLNACEQIGVIGIEKHMERVAGQLDKLRSARKGAIGQEEAEIAAQIEALSVKQSQLADMRSERRKFNITLKVARLPRGSSKQDIDGYIQQRGADAWREVIATAQPAEEWHGAHSGAPYEFRRRAIWNGTQLANYQAIIVETIHKSDGDATSAEHRLAVIAPSGARRDAVIPEDEWADDGAARKAIRVALKESTFEDDARAILSAVRRLSAAGDGPAERTVYTATGWQRIEGKWLFLAGDGSIDRDGPRADYRAEIDAQATGNHYALCGAGEAPTGAAAYLDFLRGKVCPQPLALVMAAQAALPLIHRFIGNSSRPLTWLYHQSGAMKTALTRAAVLSLYGPAFTTERGDGAPLAKWDATDVALGLLTYYYRDLPLLIDDYKQGMIHPDRFKRYVQNYSESTSRSRATVGLKIDRLRPARAIVFSTAEDLPTTGDYGIDGRLISMQLHPHAVSSDELAKLQKAGQDGHLAAFWRGFIGAIAKELDRGDDQFRLALQRLIQADDQALPGHKRAAGGLRQNRMAWLMLCQWMQQSGWLTAKEASQLSEAHLEARRVLAASLKEHQDDNRPSTIFSGVLSELLATGDYVIEAEAMRCPRCGGELSASDGWYCQGSEARSCNYQIPPARILGFRCDDGSIGLYSEKVFRVVSEVRAAQRQPFAFSAKAIWQQLEVDGQLAAKGSDGRIQVNRRNSARRGPDGKGVMSKVLLLRSDALELGEESNLPENLKKTMGTMGTMGTMASQSTETALAHGNPMGTQPESMGTQAESGDFGFPWVPMGSHAWEPENMASQSAETSRVPMVPMNQNHRIKLENTLSDQERLARKIRTVRSRMNGTYQQAVDSYDKNDMFSAAKICKAAGVDYADFLDVYFAEQEQERDA